MTKVLPLVLFSAFLPLAAAQVCVPGQTLSGGACVACPATAVSGVGARTCTCGANSTTNGLSGASLVCTACPSNAVSQGGANTLCTCLGYWDVYDPGSNACTTPASATSSVTPSATPTPSGTPSPSTSAMAGAAP